MDKVFDALASPARRQMLAYLSEDEMSAGEIAARFQMSKPAISKHLQILENAGLVTSEKRGQFVWYSISRDTLTGVIARFMQRVAPVAEAPPVKGTTHFGKPRSPGRLDRLRPRA